MLLDVVSSSRGRINFDTDAKTYIAAVQSADGQTLETAVKMAIHNFVVGCKADGTWNSLGQICLMAGPRTLAGALVALRGANPTAFNFVSGDYDRKTGLKGNASTKYLNTGYANNTTTQNNFSVGVYISQVNTLSANTRGFIGSGSISGLGLTYLGTDGSTNQILVRLRRNNLGLTTPVLSGATTGFLAGSRSTSGSISARQAGTSATASQNSDGINSDINYIFCAIPDNAFSFVDARLAYYHIGSAIPSLANLETRINNYIAAIAAAIP
jgi:hypothetical protein